VHHDVESTAEEKPQAKRAKGFQLSLKGRALRLLSQREHSRQELERKLKPFEETPGELAQALDFLQSKDFINEQRERGRIGGLRSAQSRWSKADEHGEIKPRTNGHQFELDALPDEWRVFCTAERTDLNPDATFAKFKDHWKANDPFVMHDEYDAKQNTTSRQS
jgi:DNA-binding PadR family transcriptional regulator